MYFFLPILERKSQALIALSDYLCKSYRAETVEIICTVSFSPNKEDLIQLYAHYIRLIADTVNCIYVVLRMENLRENLNISVVLNAKSDSRPTPILMEDLIKIKFNLQLV